MFYFNYNFIISSFSFFLFTFPSPLSGHRRWLPLPESGCILFLIKGSSSSPTVSKYLLKCRSCLIYIQIYEDYVCEIFYLEMSPAATEKQNWTFLPIWEHLLMLLDAWPVARSGQKTRTTPTFGLYSKLVTPYAFVQKYFASKSI